MDIVIHHVIAILEILAFADDVSAEEYVYFVGFSGHDQMALLRSRRKQSQGLLDVVTGAECGFSAAAAAGDERRRQSDGFEGRREFAVEVLGGVGEGGEHQDFAVSGIDGKPDFALNEAAELLKFGIVVRGDLPHLIQKLGEGFAVIPQVPLPRLDVDILQIDSYLLAQSEHLDVHIFLVQVKFGQIRFHVFGPDRAPADAAEDPRNRCFDLGKGEPEGVDGAFQPLEEVGRHQLLQTRLSPGLAEIRAAIARGDGVEILVLASPIREHIGQRSVDGQGKRLKLLEDLVEIRHIRQVREGLADREGCEPLGERADFSGVVERLDVFAGAGDGDRIEQFEEIEVEHLKDAVSRAVLRIEL